MNNNKELLKDLKEYRKLLFMVDVNNGFYNFGNMSNPDYNKLVPEQRNLIDIFSDEDALRSFILECHKKNSLELKKYPMHTLEGTKEADIIPEFYDEQFKENTVLFYKNCINGMLNRKLQDMIKEMANLKVVAFAGVCTDLCVMDLARTFSRFMDEINHEVKMYLVKSATDTYDAPDHNREEWLRIAYKVMEQAGIILVNNTEELLEREKSLVLR